MDSIKNLTNQSIYIGLRYSDAKAAIAWLKDALGFQEHVVYENEDGSISHAQLSHNGNLVMLGSVKDDGFGKSPKALGGVNATVYIALDAATDVDERYKQAKRAGAEIVREISDTDYGSHEFSVRDPEGHIWSFGTYHPQA